MVMEEPQPATDDTIATSTFGSDGPNRDSTARERAIVAVPQLEKYEWQDDFFVQSKVEIVAVFDHDAEWFARDKKRKCIIVMVLVAGLIGIAGLLCLVVNVDVGLRYLLHLSAAFGLALSATLQIKRSTLPHTALSTDGVIHIDQQRKCNLFADLSCPIGRDCD